MIGADAIVKCLEKEGVTTLFGYPGVAICPFFNSILKTKIESILVRSEQNAAHAASGYARVTGKTGVCVATSGPGATNLITGIATAYADSIPLVCITGQVDSNLLGSDVFQEADITGACESFVKYSYLIKDAADIPRIIKEAFHIASTGRKGPVLIDIPIDIQNAAVSGLKYPDSVNMRTYKPTVKGHAVQLKKVGKELSRAKRPLICAGGGVILSGASKEVMDYAHRYGIPVVSTMMGISAASSDDSLYFGMIGNNGKAYANRAMQESDLLIVVGARIADRAVSSPDLVAKDTVLIHIDVDPAEIGKNVGPTIPIVGDIKSIFTELAKEENLSCSFGAWIKTLEGYKKAEKPRKAPRKSYVDPAAFIRTLSEKLKDNAVYVADVGQNQMWSCGYYVAKKGRFLTSGGMGTMGYSIPAAIGAKKADKKRQVVAVCGDGSFQMSMNELATMVQYDIPIKIIVFNNGYLGLVREYQHNNYKSYSMVTLGEAPDLEMIAKAYGIGFMRIKNNTGIAQKIDEFLKAPGAGLMECMLDPLDTVK